MQAFEQRRAAARLALQAPEARHAQRQLGLFAHGEARNVVEHFGDDEPRH
jgi:hypothetical protein